MGCTQHMGGLRLAGQRVEMTGRQGNDYAKIVCIVLVLVLKR